MSDTRTSAGVDNFAVSKKMITWSIAGERAITIMTVGNLATTQSLISLLEERSVSQEDCDPSILRVPTMFQVARLVGETLGEIISGSSEPGQTSDDQFGASIIAGSQIKGGKPTVFMVYPDCNFIEITDDTPFLQFGETKYGKPILVRAHGEQMGFAEVVKLLLVSFDSTTKPNLSVGLPFDLQIYETASFTCDRTKRINADDPIYQTIAQSWSDVLREVFQSPPSYDV